MGIGVSIIDKCTFKCIFKCMNYLTTTDLRTKTNTLIQTLLAGGSVDLIHRSQVVARIKPVEKQIKVMTQNDIDNIRRLAKKMNLPELSYEERERRYRKHLEERYG